MVTRSCWDQERVVFCDGGSSQPFTQPSVAMISRSADALDFTSWIHLLPAVLVALWLCGLVVVLSVWVARWRRVSAVAREAVPLREGREAEALRRLERLGVGGSRAPIEMVASRTSLEPGVFGIVRPVLVWPEGISERLEDAHLEAILAHELWHVRRRDNLAAAIHMLVEAIFWFHPVVWWLGARLVEERERACDEDVLELGSDRQVYAESILKICEFCVRSPLACISGVTGADLKKRMVRIMSENVVRRLNFSRKLLLTVAGLLAIAAPFEIGVLHASPSRAASQASKAAAITSGYDNVSIQAEKPPVDGALTKFPLMVRFSPDGFAADGNTIQMLVRLAYGVQDDQILGAPDWFHSQRYDIQAKLGTSAQEEMSKLSLDQRKAEDRRLLQGLLEDRFHLTLRRESRELPVYELMVAEGGPKLQEAKSGESYPPVMRMEAHGGMGEIRIGEGEFSVQSADLTGLAEMLSNAMGHSVVDKTGLTGKYNFTLRWKTTPSQDPSGVKSPAQPESSTESLLAAIQEQLGLKLVPQTKGRWRFW
jgi:bla regulator protein BlaR1